MDTPSVAHESPLLEFLFVAPIDTLLETIEHTPIDEVLGGTGVSIVDEESSIFEGSIDEASRTKNTYN